MSEKIRKNKVAYHILVSGLVQGVGFRPFVYKTAKKYDCTGYVQNTNKNVIIHIEGESKNVKNFLNDIEYLPPAAASIEKIVSEKAHLKYFDTFLIYKSSDLSSEITRVSPDIAVCDECIEDMKSQKHRHNYPLINCTHCGPRFSIINNLPYDRENTSMYDFEMCSICETEYNNMNDRRFHAQPIACNDCGPSYNFHFQNKKISNIDEILKKSARIINDGGVIALKGTGGYHLLCDALNESAVSELRDIKHREKKPFAVMFKDFSSIHEYAILDNESAKILSHWTRPIVILRNKEDRQLAKGVCAGLNQTGAFLPYMPFHYQLFERLKTPAIVLTSGNFADEPVIIHDEVAIQSFNKITKGIITYNRTIVNRTDDSVAIVINNRPRLIRRSRGYAPSPLNFNFRVDGILGTGAELSNTFCIGKNDQGIVSQHIGDLKNFDTYTFYCETIEKYKKLFRFRAEKIACDLHPDYLSTRYAQETGLPLIKVQHHHAHIASCLAENNINRKVIGFSFDGTGFGDDGNIWGGEVLLCDMQNYERLNHMEYMPLPGGDKSVKEPWRIAAAYIIETMGEDYPVWDMPFMKNIDLNIKSHFKEMLYKGINIYKTSSAGRFFDAVAAMLNICTISDYHAQAPMLLENMINKKEASHYLIDINGHIGIKTIVEQILDDIQKNIDKETISIKFHNTLIQMIFSLSLKLKKETGINTIVMSGGIFQNKYISTRTEQLLLKNNFEVIISGNIPCNDAGISVGQMVIAANQK